MVDPETPAKDAISRWCSSDGRNMVVFREPAEPVEASRWFEQRA